jgi:protein-tyrosine-phosphatase
MAAGFARAYAGSDVEVLSGGSEPATNINPVAVAAMAELGIDIAHEQPRHWSDGQIRSAGVVVTMGCGDECPVFKDVRYVDWELVDPAGRTLEEVRPIRDEIEKRVKSLLEGLAT